ncbi:unnamed protein product [Cuscuta campestris]|uniref:Bifunctional inhibitor/plant lipid transfer protein/seed storage helical domain-containing protein n=1 Tax=Cuscuta campestris TaxID=132261 RepID=A0A484MIV8_9ASTE|nr:unnamed protein product [Cuscuta campestris]
MDSKTPLSLALFLSSTLLSFTLVSGCTTGCPHNPNPNPNSAEGHCPRDALKLGACANLLNGNVGAVVGTPPDSPHCCSALGGLLDLEAAVCLCTALKANVLRINIDIPISLSLLLNTCGKQQPPSDFICA